MINKAIPGIKAPSFKEIVKELYNGLIKEDKLDVRSNFDLGKEIISQGASLKMQLLEETTNKAIEHKEKTKKITLIAILIINKLRKWVDTVYLVF